MRKLRLATVWLDGCSGCHMSLLDLDAAIIPILRKVDIVYGPLVDAQEFPEDVDVTLVEGAVSTQADADHIQVIRQNTKTLVSLGDCAVTGNVAAMRNTIPVSKLLQRIYVEGSDGNKCIPERWPAAVAETGAAGTGLRQGGLQRARLSAADQGDRGPAEYAGRGTQDGNHEQDQVRIGRAMKRITIEPVSRIEGHAKVTIQLDDAGKVADTRFQVTQVRGFEKFTEGRPFYEMPGITSRICGICPISHQLAASKACDAIMAVRIPKAARLLREIIHCGQFVQSHALSFFYLSGPDLLLGMDADQSTRNVAGLIEANPELARAGIELRKFGLQVIESLAEERVHASWIVPGGVKTPMSEQTRDRLLAGIPEALDTTQMALELFKGKLDEFQEEIENFGSAPTMYASLVDAAGNLQLYDGPIRFRDAAGEIVRGRNRA